MGLSEFNQHEQIILVLNMDIYIYICVCSIQNVPNSVYKFYMFEINPC